MLRFLFPLVILHASAFGAGFESSIPFGGETAGRSPQRRRRYCQLRYCGQVLTLPAYPDLPVVQAAAAGRSKMIVNRGGGGGSGRTPGAQPHYALYPVAAVRRWLEAEGLLLADVGEYNTLCGNNR